MKLSLVTCAFGLVLGASFAHAAPITWTFTGSIDFQFTATGDLTGTIGAGDTYVVELEFGSTPSCPNSVQCVYSSNGVTTKLSINGMTFTVAPPSTLGFGQRVVHNVDGISEALQNFESDYTVQHPAGGNATSSLARDAHIDISFYLQAGPSANLLPDASWPDTIDFEAFKAAFPTDHSALSFSFQSATGTLGIADSRTAFQTFQRSTDDSTGVPAPGGLALLSLGLVVLGTTVRCRSREVRVAP